MSLRFDEDARREYLDATVFYSEAAEKIGVKFADALESAMAPGSDATYPNGEISIRTLELPLR